MLNQITYFRRKTDISRDEFRGYWREQHAAVVRDLPGMVRYVQNHVIGSVTGEGDPPFDGAAEIWFEDVESMRANVGGDALARIRADEANFIDLDTMGSMVANEHVIIDGLPDASARKLMGLIKAQASYTPEDFQDTYRNQLGPLVQKVPGIDRYVQAHSRLGIYARQTPRFDAVASLWFSNIANAGPSPEMAEVRAFEAGLIDFARSDLAWVEEFEVAL